MELYFVNDKRRGNQIHNSNFFESIEKKFFDYLRCVNFISFKKIYEYHIIIYELHLYNLLLFR